MTAARIFERVVLAAIGLNAGVVLAAGVVDGHEEVFEVIHIVILGFFAIELAVHLRMRGWRWMRRPLNAVDTILILLSLLPIFGADASLLRTARACRLLHLVKHLAPQTPFQRFVPTGRTAPLSVVLVALLLLVPVASADAVGDQMTTTMSCCGAFNLDLPPEQKAASSNPAGSTV